jgi:succinoglycan biosynthesis protein ExoM
MASDMTRGLDELRGVSVEIGIPTYKRPRELGRLLNSLSGLEVPEGTSVSVLVVDNDRLQSARIIVENFTSRSPFPVRYLVEEKTGVVHVRNRLLDAAAAEFLAMVDDDQYATPPWLRELLMTAESHEADSVIGYVQMVFPQGTRSWVVDYHRDSPVDDQSRIYYGTTNNVLIRRSSVVSRGLRFDPQFNFSGGEDTDFFQRFKEAEGKFYFSLKGKLIGPIDPGRVTPRWYIVRNFRVGQTNAMVYGRKLPPLLKIGQQLARCVVGVLLVVAGSLVFAIRRACGARLFLAGIRNIGYASTITSIRAQEYGQK